MREISRWPEVVRQGAELRAPHLVVHYLRELAQAFHACYASLPFIVDDARTRNARLALIAAARQVLQNALATARRLGAGGDVGMVAKDYKRSRGTARGDFRAGPAC